METGFKLGSKVALSPIVIEESSGVLVVSALGRVPRVLTPEQGRLERRRFELVLQIILITPKRTVTAKKLTMAAKTAWRDGFIFLGFWVGLFGWIFFVGFFLGVESTEKGREDWEGEEEMIKREMSRH